jgi:hypothetical protein
VINTGVFVFLKLGQLVLADVNHDWRLLEQCGGVLRPLLLLLLLLLCVEENRDGKEAEA